METQNPPTEQRRLRPSSAYSGRLYGAELVIPNADPAELDASLKRSAERRAKAVRDHFSGTTPTDEAVRQFAARRKMPLAFVQRALS